jgi:hypothetical protein
MLRGSRRVTIEMSTIAEDESIVEAARLYDRDVIAWATGQAALLRAGRFDELDIEHIAEEIEDVGKSEQRELASRMSVLLMHLLKWSLQPERRGASWRNTIAAQRTAIAVRLRRAPGLKPTLRDQGWWEEVWADAVADATAETGLGGLPVACPWQPDEILAPDWLPDDGPEPEAE